MLFVSPLFDKNENHEYRLFKNPEKFMLIVSWYRDITFTVIK